MTEPTRFTNLEVAESVKAPTFTVKAMIAGATAVEKADSYALAAAEKNTLIKCEMTAASKVLTLGLPEGQMAVVKNVGATNAFTVKNIATDTGTSLAVGKSLLVFAGKAKDTNVVIALD
ncbi:MAG: hypothetical protein PHE79_05095 [Eubacteriales bacterium]|nr:hypothetical protein [Eubacteriales bacterium]